MQAGNPSTTRTTDGQSRGGSLMLAGQVALTLAMLAGVGVWLLVLHGGGSRAASVQRQPVSAPQSVVAAKPSNAVTYYLVGSQEQAAAVQSWLEYDVPPPDLPAQQYAIAVAGSPEEEAGVERALAGAEAIALTNHLAPPRVIDLRAQPADLVLADAATRSCSGPIWPFCDAGGPAHPEAPR